jgi:hypothetical protein
VGLAALLTCETVLALDFELVVPVRLQALDRSISQAKVSCAVYDGSSDRVIGAKQVVFPIDSRRGDYSRDLVLRFNALAGQDPMQATHYRCGLDLLLPWADPPWQRPDPGSDQAPLRPLAGSAFSPEVGGPLPTGRTVPATRPPPYPTRPHTP